MNFKALTLIALSLSVGGCGTPGDYLFVRSENADLPLMVQGNLASRKLLLFIHGGPGGTGIARYGTSAFQTLGKDFGIAAYDQRMAGMAQGNPAKESLNLDQYVRDLDLVVEVLKKRYPDTKLYLMGHSWGGAVGTAYLSDPMRQAKIAGWMPTDGNYTSVESLRLSREWALSRAQERIAQGKDVPLAQEALSWYTGTATLTGATLIRHFNYLTKLGAYLYDPASAEKPNMPQLLFFGPYSVGSEPLNLMQTLKDYPSDQLATLDLSSLLATITLPSLVMSGRHDGSVPVGVSEACYAGLGTPADRKSLTIFEKSAHRPMDEEPQAFVSAVKAFVERY